MKIYDGEKSISVSYTGEEIRAIHNSNSKLEVFDMNNDKKAIAALLAVQVINDYIESECAESNHTFWYDKYGYCFRTDMGYFYEGLENFEAMLIKRLRGAKVEGSNA